EDVLQNIQKRDHIDSSREDSPLRQADDSIVLDNSEMTVDQQMEWFGDVYSRITGGTDGKD
ncbi:MAG: cytidylate kinase, partial [Bacteroidetes bacterium]|nr:cytidylate kinase [Bacteroidota bacterium]